MAGSLIRGRSRATLLACAALALCANVGSAQANVTQHGYLTAPDGASLNYTVVLPSAEGRHPVAFVYDGYAAGYDPVNDNGNAPIAATLLAKGFAVVGVNVPGTGCSTGSIYPPFGHAWAQDGAAAVAWAASQPWSTGKVGMFGASFPGFMALYVAAERPAGLVAIAPTGWTGSFYDAVYPGGIYDDVFPNLFDVDQLNGSLANEQDALGAGDLQCILNFASDQAGRVAGPPPLQYVALQAPLHPYKDDIWTNQIWPLENAIPNIQVPVLSMNSYQDQIASATGINSNSLFDAHKSWFILTNGWHAIGNSSKTWAAQTVAFLDHFVAGTDNGWQNTPTTQIWHETELMNGSDAEPRWVTTSTSWPPPSTTTSLQLSAHNLLSSHPASGTQTPDAYVYPLPAGSMFDLQGALAAVANSNGNLWGLPLVPGGNVSYTTPSLSADTEIEGSSSLNLWLSSTAPDTDVQATITEVRPDGQEQYIQRGWLRMSKRKLGADSTTTRPRPTYLQSDVQPLALGVPTYARVPIYPFDHTFRRGSSIRISVEAPVGLTGTFGFLFNPVPALNTVWHDPAHPSQWVYNTVPVTAPVPPLPACGAVLEEPCRTNNQAVPATDANPGGSGLGGLLGGVLKLLGG